MGLNIKFCCHHARSLLSIKNYGNIDRRPPDNFFAIIYCTRTLNLHMTFGLRNFCSTPPQEPKGKNNNGSSGRKGSPPPKAECIATDPTLNYYEILNVPVTASSKQIKAAYYALTKIYHPDRQLQKQEQEEQQIETVPAATLNSDLSSQIFRRITEAYECLSNERKRQRYDYALHRKKYAAAVDNSASSYELRKKSPDKGNESASDDGLGGGIDFDSLDDDVLRELLRYERLRRFGRRGRLDKSTGFTTYYESWLRERKRRDKPTSGVGVASSSNNTSSSDGDFESYYDYVRRKEKEMDEFLSRDPWKSTTGTKDGEEKQDEPRQCTKVEWTPADIDKTITYNPLALLYDLTRRKIAAVKSNMADKDSFRVAKTS